MLKRHIPVLEQILGTSSLGLLAYSHLAFEEVYAAEWPLQGLQKCCKSCRLPLHDSAS